MGSLGDLLKASDKSSLILNSICEGEVYLMTLTKEEGVKPKDPSDDSRNKYFIVIGKDKSGIAICAVLINTKINQNISQPLQNLHYPLKAATYEFLKQNRFAYCGQIKIISKEAFSTQFRKPVGAIYESDLNLIKEAVTSSPITPKKDLKRFGLIS